jgi:4-hydroxybenzoate polyprenyltransferase
LYTCGVLLPSIAEARINYTIAHSLLFIQFSLVALTNLLVLSWLDRESDFKDGLTSFALIAGLRMSSVLIWTSFVLCMVLTLTQVYFVTLKWPALIVGTMEVVLLLIYAGKQRPDRLLLQRMIGDGVFIIPILYLVW